MQLSRIYIKLMSTLLLLAVTAGWTHAQKQQTDTLRRDSVPLRFYTLTGRILGGEEKEVLPGAYIYVGKKKVAVTTTNEEGRFTLPKLAAEDAVVSVTYIGYQPFSKTYTLKGDLDVGDICLQPTVLDEVIISATPPLAIQRGDTTQFNAGALKLAVDADLEDLLKKLPGFEIVDGKIMAQGKEVTKLYIDGMEYSFNDPAAALKNLPAKLVARIKMFDDPSEEAKFSGYDDGSKYRTLNIETHDPNKMKLFGTASAGYGITDPLKNTFKEKNYQASLSGNLFDPKRKITVNGDIHNNGQSNSLPGSRYQGKGGENNNQYFYANISSKLGEKVTFSGNYSLSRSNSYSGSVSRQDYFPTERYESRIYDNENHSWSKNSNHFLNVHMEYEEDKKNKFSFSPTLSVGKNNSRSLGMSGNVENNDTINLSNTSDRNESNNVRLGGDLLWMHAFEKRGRTFVMRLDGSYSRNTSDQSQNNEERSLNDENVYTDTLRNLLIGNNRNGYSWSGALTWSEPLTEHARLGVNYSYRENIDHSDKESFSYKDKDFQELIGVDTAQTNRLENEYKVHSYGVNYNYHQKKLRVNAGITVNHTQMSNCYRYLNEADSLVSSVYTDLSPRMSLGIETNKNANLDIRYNGSSSSPNAVQLQDVLDVSDPLQVSKGNPGLKKSYHQSIGLSYNRAFPEKSTFFDLDVNGGQTFNQVATNVKFIQQDTVINDYTLVRGARLTVPVNLDGNWNMSMTAGFSFPWKKLRFNTRLSYSFSHTPSIYDDLKNITSAHTGALHLTLTTNISEDFDATIMSSSSYSYSRNTTTGGSQYFNENMNVFMRWIFWKGFYVGGTYGGGFYITKKDEKVNQSQHMLDLQIGKKFGKSKQIDVVLSANDILQQRNSLNYSLNDLYTQTSYQTMPSSYYMLTFSYRFNNINKQK